MSQRAVEQAVGKLVTDEGFREAFFRDPAPASREAGLELSRAEIAALFGIPRQALSAFCACLDDRICRLFVSRSDVDA
jgi:hypothetical protein